MAGEPEYDTRRLRTLQKDLGRLNEAYLPPAARGGRGTASKRRAEAAVASPEAAAPAEGANRRSATAKTGPRATPGLDARPKAKAAPKSRSNARTPAASGRTAEPAKKAPATKKQVVVAAKPANAPKTSAKSRRTAPEAGPSASVVEARPAVAPQDKGKAGARRLLTLLRRSEGDDSPPVPGTDFTEGGVVRLLAHLRRRKSHSFRFLRRLLRVLTRPAALGMRTSAGVSVERLQLVARQLEEIEIHGWDHFHSRRVARRGRQGLPFAPAVGAPDAPVAEG